MFTFTFTSTEAKLLYSFLQTLITETNLRLSNACSKVDDGCGDGELDVR